MPQVCHGGADEEAAEARAQAPTHAIRKVPPSRPPAPGRARPAPTANSGRVAARQTARPARPRLEPEQELRCAAAGAGAEGRALSAPAPHHSYSPMVVRPGSTLLSGSGVRFLASGPVARRCHGVSAWHAEDPRRQPVDASADADAPAADAPARDAAAAAVRTAVAAAERPPWPPSTPPPPCHRKEWNQYGRVRYWAIR